MKTKKPTPKQELTEREYLEKSAKMTEFFVDIDKRLIEVPFDEEPDDMAMFLVNNRGFQIQYVIPGSTVKNKLFTPEPFHKVIEVKGEKIIEPEYKPMERFKTRDGYYINLIGIKANKDLEFAYVDSLKANFTISKISASINVKHKVWVFLGR